MLTLAFDTATPWGRFALADTSGVLAYQPHNVSGSFADALLPVVAEMLAAAGRSLSEVSTIGVTCGPGSFTGVRIGVATAKGLAYALAARLVAVPTLAAMGAALLADHPDQEVAIPALDARRGEIFAAIYRRRGCWVETLVAPEALAPEAWWETIKQNVADVDAPAYGGDGVPLLVGQGSDLRPELLARGVPIQRVWSSAHPATARALAAALVAPATPDLAPVDPFTLVPTYLRASDAEVKLRLDLTPRHPSTAVQVHRSGPARPGDPGDPGDVSDPGKPAPGER